MGWGAALGSAFSGILNFGASMSEQANNNMLAANQAALQREFAQSGIQWRVADAEKAGVHPLFALGAQTHSYTPQQIGGGGYNIPDLGSMGQNIERALRASQSQGDRDVDPTRMASMNEQADSLRLENMALQNDLLRTNIVRANAQLGPPMPTLSGGGGLAGQQPGLGIVENKPQEIITPNPARPDQSAGRTVPQSQWAYSPDRGGIIPFPAAKLPGTEDSDSLIGLDWYIRNRLNPMLDSRGMKPDMGVVREAFPGAIDVTWSRANMRWEPVFGDRGPRYIGASVGRRMGINDALRAMQFNKYRYGR